MGTFANYYGNVKVPEEKLPELTQRMMRLLEQIGIMDYEKVSMFGKELTLLHPLQLDSEGWAAFNYNYFDDDFWEHAAYNAKTGEVSSNKVGCGYFCKAVIAAYILMEFYTEEYGLTALEDSLCPGAWQIIGWLNHLFDEQYKNTRLMDPWKVYRLLKEFDKYDTFEDEDPMRSLAINPSYTDYVMLGTIRYVTVVYTDIVRSAARGRKALDQFEQLQVNDPDDQRQLVLNFTAIMSAIAMDNYLERTSSQKLREASDYVKNSEWKRLYREDKDGRAKHITFCGLTELCASSLERLRDSEEASQSEQLQHLKNIMSNHETFYPPQNSGYYTFWFASYLLPKETTLKLISDVYELDFWALLEELEHCVEEKSEEWNREFLEVGNECEPVKKRSLGELLRFEDRGLSEDDRAYFWRPDGDVKFSDEMYQWMEELKTELHEIESEEGVLIEEKDFIKTFMETLNEANQTFSRIYFFRDAFYELLTCANRRRVQAAVILLQRMIKRCGEEYSKVEKRGFMWGLGGYGEYHPARLKIKRYLAILGNPELRKIQFGF